MDFEVLAQLYPTVAWHLPSCCQFASKNAMPRLHQNRFRAVMVHNRRGLPICTHNVDGEHNPRYGYHQPNYAPSGKPSGGHQSKLIL